MNNKEARVNAGFKWHRVFTLAAVAFTFISLYNGYGIYDAMLGMYLALLISVVFEVASLLFFSFLLNFKYSIKTHVFIIALAILIRFVCGTANFVAYSFDVQKRYSDSGLTAYKKLREALPAYRLHIANQISINDKQNKKNYLLRHRNGIDEIIKERKDDIKTLNGLLDKAYSITEQNIIKNKTFVVEIAAITGVKITFDDNHMSNVEKALHEAFGADSKDAFKLMGLILSLVVELVILTCIIMSHYSKKKYIERLVELQGTKKVQDDNPKSTAPETGKVQSTKVQRNADGQSKAKTEVKKGTRRQVVPSERVQKKWLEDRKRNGFFQSTNTIKYEFRDYHRKFVSNYENKKN